MTEQTDTEEQAGKGELEDLFAGRGGGGGDPAFDWLGANGGGGGGVLPPQGGDRTPAADREEEPTGDDGEEPPEVRGVEPPKDASKRERLAHYEDIIDRERNRYRQTVAEADLAFCEATHEPLWRINREKVYKQCRGKDGKPFRSFKAYLEERWGISRAHGYRILNEYPVRQALAGQAPRFLSTRQVAKLAALLRATDAATVLQVWELSEKKSPDGLQATINKLGLSIGATESLDELSEADRARLSQFDRWSKTASALDAEQARKVLAGDPQRARQLYDQVKPFVDALAEVAAVE